MLAIGLGRVSSQDQERRGYSLPEQELACRQKAQALGATEFIWIQEAVPGELIDTPGLTEARELVRRRRPDLFVCMDPDRFSRETVKAILVANEVEAAGTRLVFVQHNYENTPEGRLFFTMRVAFAEYERAKIRERTARGRRGKLRRGGLPFRVAPYGYTWDQQHCRPVPDPERAGVVRDMFRWVSGEQVGATAVATRLNSQGVPAPAGTWWYRQTVSHILRNPVYRGDLVVMRLDRSGMGKNRFLPPAQRVRRQLRPEAEWVTLPVPALVDAETWERTQAVLDTSRRRRPGGAPTAYLLSGLCVCGLCKGPVTGYSLRNAGGRRYLYYACKRRRQGRLYNPARHPQRSCPARHLPAGPVDAYVWQQVRQACLNLPLFQEALRRLQPDPSGPPGAPDRAGVRRRLRATEAEMVRLRRLYARGLVESEPAAEQELAALKRRIALLRHEAAPPRRPQPGPEAAPPAAPPAPGARWQAWGDRLSRAETPERRFLIRALVRQVILAPGQAPRIDWQEP